MHQLASSVAKIPKFSRHLIITYSSRHNHDSPSDLSDKNSLKTDVIHLYKDLLYISRDWPTDLRPRIRSAFAENRHVDSPDEIRKLIARGQYVCREITATYHLSKYRAMKRRYYNEDSRKELDEMFRNLGEQQ